MAWRKAYPCHFVEMQAVPACKERLALWQRTPFIQAAGSALGYQTELTVQCHPPAYQARKPGASKTGNFLRKPKKNQTIPPRSARSPEGTGGLTGRPDRKRWTSPSACAWPTA